MSKIPPPAAAHAPLEVMHVPPPMEAQIVSSAAETEVHSDVVGDGDGNA